MNLFKNIRELLLLSYVNNVVSDREFVLPYDAYQSKNPDLNYQQYDPFNLDDIDSAECKAEFRIEKADLPRLAEALQLPPTFRLVWLVARVRRPDWRHNMNDVITQDQWEHRISGNTVSLGTQDHW